MAAAAVLSPWASKQQLSFSPNATEVFGGRRAGEFPRSRRCRNGKPRTRSLGGLSKPLDNASAQVQPLQGQSHSPISSHRVALGVVKRRTPPPPRPSEDGVKLIKRHRFALKICILHSWSLGTLDALETRRYQGNSSMAVLTNSIALLVFISVVLAASDLDAPQSISSLDDYGRQRVCARGCFWGGRGGDPASYDSIGGSLSCDTPGNTGSPNWCFCRADQQSVAVSYLSNCVNSKCGKNAVDTNLATSLYLAYCTPKVAPKPDAISTTTTPTAAATGPAQTVPVTSGPGAVQTVYVTSGSRSRLTINFSLALVLVKPILASMVVCFR